MLEAVGVTSGEESIYRALLDDPHATPTDLAARTGLTVAQARRALSALANAGLVSRTPGPRVRFVPARPDVAVEALILRRQEELERARLQAARLLERFQRSLRRSTERQVVQLLTGREAIAQHAGQLVASARREVLMFDKPPYLGPMENPSQYAALGRGVRWRAVYAPESLQMPDRVADLHRLALAGEQGRIAPRLPLKLAIADQQLALLPLTVDAESADRTAILVTASSLLDTVIMLFEMVWERSVPVPVPAVPGTGAAPGAGAADAVCDAGAVPPDSALLALLAAGVKDEVMARQLGLSLRTVRRRIAALMNDNGVRTRFQLGLVASRRGWI